MARIPLSRLALVLVAILVACSAIACEDTPTSATAAVAFSQTDLRVGTGAEAVAGSVITVHYTGWFYDSSRADRKGVLFESSRTSTPFEFTLGAGQVIQGWDTGLVGMKAGGLRQLIIPPTLAYGGSRTGMIPPNAPLVFEVDLLEVK